MARPPPRKAKRPRGAYTQALRLIKIYDYLAQGGRVRPKELAQKLGLAVRTVQRDLKILGQAVDDLESDDRDGKVEYRLATRARSSFLHLRHAVAIALGARLIDFLAGPGLAVDITPVVDDIRLQLKTPDRRRFDAWSRRVVVIAPAQRTYRDRDLLKTFDAILRAMLELWPVWVSYLSPSRARAGHPARRLRIPCWLPCPSV